MARASRQRRITCRRPTSPILLWPRVRSATASGRWTISDASGRARRSHLHIPEPPAVPPATSIALKEVSSRATGVEVTASITVPNVDWLSAVELRRGLGACPTSDDGQPVDRVAIKGTSATIDDSSNTVEGTWCYVAFTIDLWGRSATSGASRSINHVPPQAPSPTDVTASIEADGRAHRLDLAWRRPDRGQAVPLRGPCAGPIAVDANFLDAVPFVDAPLRGTSSTPGPTLVCTAMRSSASTPRGSSRCRSP